MNLFKRLIPKDKAQEVTELESWTVEWRTHVEWTDGYGKVATYHKVFIKEADAIEFKRQLVESAKFLGCYVKTFVSKN